VDSVVIWKSQAIWFGQIGLENYYTVPICSTSDQTTNILAAVITFNTHTHTLR